MFGVPHHLPRVLIVDDDEFDLEYIVGILRDEFEVVEATTASQALEEIAGGNFDVVISDSLLPEMSGEDLLFECRARQPTISLVLLSGVLSLVLLHYVNTGDIHACSKSQWTHHSSTRYTMPADRECKTLYPHR